MQSIFLPCSNNRTAFHDENALLIAAAGHIVPQHAIGNPVALYYI